MPWVQCALLSTKTFSLQIIVFWSIYIRFI